MNLFKENNDSNKINSEKIKLKNYKNIQNKCTEEYSSKVRNEQVSKEVTLYCSNCSVNSVSKGLNRSFKYSNLFCLLKNFFRLKLLVKEHHHDPIFKNPG